MGKEKKEKNTKPSLLLLTTFWALVGIFALMMGLMMIPLLRQYLRYYLFVIVGSILLLGVILIFLTWKEKIEGSLKRFLMLTGGSAAGFVIAMVLHNFLYALNVRTSHITALKYLTEGLYTIFFFLAIPIFPLSFLIGVVGSVLQFSTRKKS